MSFVDRTDAGRQLAKALGRFQEWHPVVIGLPRGGVEVACEVAQALAAPLDVIVVRKLGLPGNEEYGIGAIAEDGVIVLDQTAMRLAGVTHAVISHTIDREMQVLRRRVTRIREQHKAVPLKGRMVIIVDDGLATGLSARAACRVARQRGASSVVLAMPIAPADWHATMGGDADMFEALHEPNDFDAVGQFYLDFSQTNDEDVLRCLI
jgi:putative phosphoribosyl transferase